MTDDALSLAYCGDDHAAWLILKRRLDDRTKDD